jgi:dTDP-4-dehydrorhamnose 3,5-epimerase
VQRLATRLEGPLLLQPDVHGDERGFLVETFRASVFAAAGVREDFVQDNHSRSRRGVIRGMHFQVDPPAAKLVRCARGAIFDVLVDIRPGSGTYGRWEAYELSDENARVLYVPVAFAHGFAVLSDVADVLYKQSAEWHPGGDRGFAPEDLEVGIDWPIPVAERILSERDRSAPALAELEAQLAPG